MRGIWMKWKRHKQLWGTCEKCKLCQVRRNTVLGKGKIPADILFVGEAPGAGEDVLGKPFVGPAGHLLDRLIQMSGVDEHRMFFTNLVACVPKQNGKKIKEPPEYAIDKCESRLSQVISMVKPTAIVCVGKLSEREVLSRFGGETSILFYSIIHPAALLRMDVSQKEFMAQRSVVDLSEICVDVEEFKNAKSKRKFKKKSKKIGKTKERKS
jgi:uracil-DNA glycosylase family 4